MNPLGYLKLAGAIGGLVIVLGLAAWGAAGHRDAAQLKRWAEVTCAAAGEPFEFQPHTDPATKRPAKRQARGVACARRVGTLATFERETDRQTAAVLVDALEQREGKTIADTASAARDAKAARAAAERMEKEDASVEGDRVGADWFDALSGVAGLR